MHVHPISTFRLFQEGHLLRNSIAIFALTTLFYFIGAELRLVHELSLFWPLNGVMAGGFARYVWLNRLHYYAISYVAMLVYDAITTEWGLVSLVINFSNMMFIVTVALLVVRDKRLGKNKYEPVSALRLFNYCLIAALLCAIVGAIGSVSIDSLDFWPLLADWFSEQFSTGVLIVPLTVMLLDIDYFKSINDNYGHECGDKVLSVFARHIQKIVGDKGLVARMGGEEFAVAVPSVNPVDGLLMAEKIRKGVELQPFTWQQKTLYLTVSIGVGSGRASYRTLTDDFNKLMVEADTCLYRSKKDGRNRTSTMRYGEEVV
ncbi:GGDEF domain-containing protein [Shigella sonnei]|uniref:diguanylate cyclase n=10 Tax=Shigella TaxID=620 RepID=A0A8H8ZAL2_SHIFL|nr:MULTISPECIES: diguanylate cyclase [Shigella]EEZ5520820.1 GGDEF domain-containing protein [Escherichia coli]EFP8788353.1 GGDEF domain-containing protein [Shigella flexneri]EFZ3599444.1 GGDEF domain-containing protein [Shigella boydii]EIQ42988.1 diguanylate cyclase domain protein [Shigella sonnei 3226-85]EIQ44939.1 diguanylate cyclase domain protein [Shigella sonnei 3233-85]EJL17617.1 diguanylate cyclase domain protein [Shigella sonnei str. Moseley]